MVVAALEDRAVDGLSDEDRRRLRAPLPERADLDARVSHLTSA